MPGKNIGQAGDRTSDLLFSSPTELWDLAIETIDQYTCTCLLTSIYSLPHNPDFSDDPVKRILLKTLLEKEKIQVIAAFSPFPTIFSTFPEHISFSLHHYINPVPNDKFQTLPNSKCLQTTIINLMKRLFQTQSVCRRQF